MTTITVYRCSACAGMHASVPLQRDKGGAYFVCPFADPRRLGVARRFIDGTGRTGARVAVEFEGARA